MRTPSIITLNKNPGAHGGAAGASSWIDDDALSYLSGTPQAVC